MKNKNKRLIKLCLVWSIAVIFIGIFEKHTAALIIGILFTGICVYFLNKNKQSVETSDEIVPPSNPLEPSGPLEYSEPYVDYTVNLDDVSNNSTPTANIKKEKHKIAGVSNYEKNFKSLFSDNPLYDYTKKELIEEEYFEKIYEQTSDIQHVDLIPEPDNPYDSNAVKVIFDDKHVGYIKKGSCSHIKKLLRSGCIKGIDGYLIGGKYKQLIEYEEEDDEEDDDEEDDDFETHSTYELERDCSDYYAYIIIYTEIHGDKLSPTENEIPQRR